MYNKIINLKSKLANYNNNSVLLSQREIQEKSTIGNEPPFEISESKLSRTFIENAHSQDNSPVATEEAVPGQRPMMSKINELKKKWNDVSSKNRGEGISTPDKSKINIKK